MKQSDFKVFVPIRDTFTDLLNKYKGLSDKKRGKKMDRDILEKLCMYLLNRGVRKFKKEIEVLNVDGSLDVYLTVMAVISDTDPAPAEKNIQIYTELKAQFRDAFLVLFERAEAAAKNKNSFQKAA